MASRLSDSQVLEHARRYHELRAQAKAIEEDAKRKHRDPIIAELQRRGATQIKGQDLTVTMTSKTTVNYVYEKARTRLAEPVLRRVRRWVIDKDVMRAEIKAGRVSEADAAACADTKTSDPYLVVTPKAA